MGGIAVDLAGRTSVEGLWLAARPRARASRCQSPCQQFLPQSGVCGRLVTETSRDTLHHRRKPRVELMAVAASGPYPVRTSLVPRAFYAAAMV
jgi:L-aspartate oxidase